MTDEPQDIGPDDLEDENLADEGSEDAGEPVPIARSNGVRTEPEAFRDERDRRDRAELEAQRRAVLEVHRAMEPEYAPINPELLKGSTYYLDHLAILSPEELAAEGITFEVFEESNGASCYLHDSDWGDRVPTLRAVAEVYGPGRYKVRVRARRKGGKGYYSHDIRFRIGDSRSNAGSNGTEQWLRDLVRRMVDRSDRVLDQNDAQAREVLEQNGGIVPAAREEPAGIAGILPIVRGLAEIAPLLKGVLGRGAPSPEPAA